MTNMMGEATKNASANAWRMPTIKVLSTIIEEYGIDILDG